MPLARTRASSATASSARWPRRTTDRNRGRTESDVGGGLPVRRGPVHRSGHGHWAQPHGSVFCYPPWGGRGITECRNPYFTTYPLPRRPAPAPRPALPAIGTPLSIPFACGAPERAALASWTSSIAAGVDPCQPAGTDSRPRVLASPIWAVTLLAVNGAPLTPAVPPMGRPTPAAPAGINPSPFSSAVA